MRTELRVPALAIVAILVAGCAGGASPAASPTAGASTGASAPASGSPSGGAEQGADDGSQLTMWTRAATEARATSLVKAYNQSHKNQIQLTVVPTDDYQTKVGAAAPNNQLPDLFSADVVFMPNWTSQGLFTDLTSRIDGLPFIANVAQAHIKTSTWEGKKYGLPFIMDLSVWMWNKALFRKAGLDPDKGPTTLKEFAADAKAVREKVGGNVYGTFFGGNCGGCNVFTWWPIAWADGQQIMNDDGTQSMNNSDEMKQVYATFRQLWGDGAIHPDSRSEAGPTWTGYFPKGTIGVMPMPASLQGMANDKLKDADIGVTPIAGVNGGQSTFVGGDSIGVSKDSKLVDQAWNFLSWMLGDQAQVEVVAKEGNVVARTDLADNKYSSADPRLVTINKIVSKGQTPFALKFGQTYNDPQGPWIPLFRDAVFGDASKVDADNDAINQSLGG